MSFSASFLDFEDEPDTSPEPILSHSGAPSWLALERESAGIAAMLGDRLLDHAMSGDRHLAGLRVLDFGAGAGGVAQVLGQRFAVPSDACDRDAAGMDLLTERLPAVACRAHGPIPPLPYAEATFDAVYATTAWLRLSPSAGLLWLHEIARILKEGGIAMILICGPGGVRQRRETARPGWQAVADIDLCRTGALFMPLGPSHPREGGEEHGRTAYTHGHILSRWEPILPVEALYPQAIDALDLVVLRRPPRPRPELRAETPARGRFGLGHLRLRRRRTQA